MSRLISTWVIEYVDHGGTLHQLYVSDISPESGYIYDAGCVFECGSGNGYSSNDEEYINEIDNFDDVCGGEELTYE